MATTVQSCQMQGLKGYAVDVEVDILQGMSHFSLVGLGDTSVKEAKERVRSAIKNSGYEYPRQKKIINLAPADLQKHGPQFDLAIAVGLLLASKQIKKIHLENSFIMGELALNGSIRPINGALTIALTARSEGAKKLIVPIQNVDEAAMIEGIEIIGMRSLKDLVEYSVSGKAKPERSKIQKEGRKEEPINFDDIYGNEYAKRALEIAAAGGHHILLTGPPGVGKTVLAKATASILPPLSYQEKIEVIQIHSTAGNLQHAENIAQITARPFRQIHPGCTKTALLGGGSHLKPGEISLAHRGILFIDEIPEFPREHLESLRLPLEEKQIHLSRSRGTVVYPSQFMLIASMNPCPCGNFGSDHKPCTCRPYQVIQYQKKLSGPLLSRIDMTIEVERQPTTSFQKNKTSQQQAIQNRIAQARKTQKARFKKSNILTNSEMSTMHINALCHLSDKSKRYLQNASEKLQLSGRQYHQAIKLAQTIADLEAASREPAISKNNTPKIEKKHIAEALQYRKN